MTRKIRFKRKDTYLIIVGLLISFMVQSIYDAIRQSLVVFNITGFNQVLVLLGLAALFSALTLRVLNNVVEEK